MPAETYPKQIGPYVIDGLLGRGGMGQVLCGKDPEFRRDLAIKLLLEEHQGKDGMLRRFEAEARLMGQLEHPGIPRVHAWGTIDDGRPYLVMKRIAGRTLQTLLAEREPNDDSLPRFLPIFEDICQIVAYTHSRGIINRDLKPSNIMVGEFGEVQVMDWGLAKSLHDTNELVALGSLVQKADLDADPEKTIDYGYDSSQPATDQDSATEAGIVMGTPRFMPPEQARGEMTDIDERCDVFTLGGILCVMLTGQPPFRGETALAQARAGDLADAYQRLDQCGDDAKLIRLAKQCLSVEKEARPPHAGAVATAVADYQTEVRHRLRQAEIARAKMWWQIGLAVMVLLLTAGVYWFIEERSRREMTALHKYELANQRIGQSLKRARALRQDVQNQLAKPGGVFRLLEDPADWQRRLDNAKAELQRAVDLEDNAGGVTAELASQIHTLERQLAQDERHRTFALELEQIREQRSTLVEGNFENATYALKDYPNVFRSAGLHVNKDTPDAVAAKIKQSPIREQLVAALDNWAYGVFWIQQDNALQARLLEIAHLADPNPVRKQMTQQKLWKNRKGLQILTERVLQDPARLAKLRPQTLALIGSWLAVNGDAAERWSRQAQMLYPDDFWLNFDLGVALSERYPTEAAGFFRTALGIRPKSEVAWNNLGNVLLSQQKLDEAIAVFQKALDINPRYGMAWTNLGSALDKNERFVKAEHAYRKATEFAPSIALAWSNLGSALGKLNRFVEAERACRNAVRLDDKYPQGWSNLGAALEKQHKYAQAEKAFRQASALRPTEVLYLFNLGSMLLVQGEFVQADKQFQRCRELARSGHYLKDNVEQRILLCQRFLALEKQLPTVLSGKLVASAGKLLELANLCHDYKKRYRDAVRLYAKLFTEHPHLADDVAKHYRYNAALAAILAAHKAKGKDRAELRDQAFKWLLADLVVYRKLMQSTPPAAVMIHDKMQHWQQEVDLVSLRETKHLAALPEAERGAWQKLWADARTLRKEARESYRETVLTGKLVRAKKEMPHVVTMVAGTTYVIDMRSNQFDTFLKLFDAAGKKLAENDDIYYPGNLNSRLIFQPKNDGEYRLLATSFQQQGRGAYELRIRAFVK